MDRESDRTELSPASTQIPLPQKAAQLVPASASSPPHPSQVPSELGRVVFESAKEDYKDAYDTWKSLDQKAQISSAAAGILLAVVFAAIRDLKPDSPKLLGITLVIAAALLIEVVRSAVAALRVREVSRAPYGAEMKEDAINLLETEGEKAGERINDYYFTAADKIVHASNDLHRLAKDKASGLDHAGRFFQWSAGFVVLSALLQVCKTLFRWPIP